MKLNVSGIETIELTDPKGLCNQPVGGQPFPQTQIGNPPMPSPPQGGQPPATIPAPQIWPQTPYTTGDPLKHTSIWSKTTSHKTVPRFDPDHDEKWGLGLPQTPAPEPQKWEKSWQAKMSRSPEGQIEVEG